MRVGAGAVCLTALVFIAAGLGPFRWGRGGQGDAASVGAFVQGGGPTAGFNDTFSGTASETQQSATQTRFSLQATASGDRALSFDIELTLAADAGGGNTATSNSIVLTDSSGSTVCSGQLQQLSQSAFTGTCRGSGPFSGQTLQLTGSFDGGLASQVSGSLQAKTG